MIFPTTGVLEIGLRFFRTLGGFYFGIGVISDTLYSSEKTHYFNELFVIS